MHVYTRIHTGLAHACTPCAPYVQSLSRMPYEVTSTHIHAHMEMEKGRSRQGERSWGEGSSPRGHRAEAGSGFQPPAIPKAPPDPLPWQLHTTQPRELWSPAGRMLTNAPGTVLAASTNSLPLPHTDLFERNCEPNFQVRKLRLRELNHLLTQSHRA